MDVREIDVIPFELSNVAIKDAIKNASIVTDYIIDRNNLHSRDYLERYIDCLLGEIAEKTVIEWLKRNGKFAESAVYKTSKSPDLGHDIWVYQNKVKKKVSIKSSVSAKKSNYRDILNTFTIATQQKEIRDINIQVYFWLQIDDTPRKTVPCVSNCALFSWATKEDLQNGTYNNYYGEKRRAPNKKLKDFRPMSELLEILE